jgi:hypothetical protein
MPPISAVARHGNDRFILGDWQNDILTEIKVEHEAPESPKDHGRDGCHTPESPAKIVFTGIGECAHLFEQLFWRDRETVGNLGRTIEDFQDVVAQRTAELARRPTPRGQFDSAEASVAFGADDVAFLHTGIMHAAHNRSKTTSGRDRPA